MLTLGSVVEHVNVGFSVEPVPELRGDRHQHQEPDGRLPKEETERTAEAGVHLRHEGEGLSHLRGGGVHLRHKCEGAESSQRGRSPSQT